MLVCLCLSLALRLIRASFRLWRQHHLHRLQNKDFLNMFFGKVYKPIPLVYILVLAMLWRHPENVELEKVKVVHYCAAGSKPWRYTGEEANMDREDIKMLVDKWWDVYNDETLDFKLEITYFRCFRCLTGKCNIACHSIYI